MREIEFRGQKTSTKEWVYGSLVNYSDAQIAIFVLKNGGHDVFIVIPETVGQFTGLHDKNGTKIFEGDVVESESGLWEVYFNRELSAFVLDVVGRISLVKLGIPDEKSEVFIKEIEPDFLVIGNIYEHPQLLHYTFFFVHLHPLIH